MRKAERQSAILDRIDTGRSVDVGDLSTELGVSGATIRRDLQILSRNGRLVRIHGGAVANRLGQELPPEVKAARHQSEKRRIGQAAAELVEDGAVVGMTGGTTTLELARALTGRRGITVVTNAVNIAHDLTAHRELRLVVIGGIMRRSAELVGPAAEAMLANYHLDLAFIGVDGLTPAEGLTTFDEMEAQTDLAFLRRAGRAVVVADGSKVGLVRFARIAPLAAVHEIVTDSSADPGQVAALRAAGPHVRTV